MDNIFNFAGYTREQALGVLNSYYDGLEESVKSTTIKCDSVEYRQGFIEVTPGIHDGCVNIEAWSTCSDISGVSSVRVFPSPVLTGGVELELGRDQAAELVGALQRFLEGK